MKVYTATAYVNREEAREFIRKLRLAGLTPVGDWTSHTTEGETVEDEQRLLRAFAAEDRAAVAQADAVVLLHDECGKASFTEFGMALSSTGKYVLVVGGQGAAPVRGPIFYLLDDVLHFDTQKKAVAWLLERDRYLGRGLP